MCGRYHLTADLDELAAFYDSIGGGFYNPGGTPRLPRFNIAPSQTLPVVVMNDTERELRGMRWGLIPHWSKEASSAYRMINARVESAHMKPAYRVPFRRARCLVPATGWYEWMKRAEQPKLPFQVHQSGGGPFTFGGLWSRWEPEQGDPVDSFTILTGEAHPNIASIHPRMPIVVPESLRAAWLDPSLRDAAHIRSVLAQCGGRFIAYPVSTHLNKPSNDDALCLERV